MSRFIKFSLGAIIISPFVFFGYIEFKEYNKLRITDLENRKHQLILDIQARQAIGRKGSMQDYYTANDICKIDDELKIRRYFS